MPTSKRTSKWGIVALCVAMLALIIAGAFYLDSKTGTGDASPKNTPLATPSRIDVPGYTGTDLFGDQRLSFQYKNKTWQDAYGKPKKGVHTIVLTTHCGLSDITQCPTLRLTDMRSAEFDRRFGDAPVINVLDQEPCPLTGEAPMTKLTDGGKQSFGEWSGVYYMQAQCAATPVLPVILNRHVWVSKSAELMVELEDTKYANASDKDIEDVTTSLKHLSKMDD